MENLLTVDRDRDHADARRMASLFGATGYSIRADGRVGGAAAWKFARHLDGRVSLLTKRDIAPRLQPLHGAATDRVPAQLSMAGARAGRNKLHRIADWIRRGVLVRDRSRPPSSCHSRN